MRGSEHRKRGPWDSVIVTTASMLKGLAGDNQI